jgi:Icc-related predicted phosphoesterase
MKIVCLSDTHARHELMQHPVPDGDVLIHAGDLTGNGSLEHLARFQRWMEALPHRHKLVIAGNHDHCLEARPRQAEALLRGCTYLRDSALEIDGVLFYGSPWQPRFMNMAFNLDPGPELAAVWARIPEQVDVLVTHGPPHGILDCCFDGFHAGCTELERRVAELAPALHVFGHIHEGHGQVRRGATRFVNASVYALDYAPSQAPLVIEL